MKCTPKVSQCDIMSNRGVRFTLCAPRFFLCKKQILQRRRRCFLTIILQHLSAVALFFKIAYYLLHFTAPNDIITIIMQIKKGLITMAPKVTLLTYTPNPEQTVAMAAKLCYSPSGIEDIRSGLTPEKTAGFVDMLAELGHQSPMEHASFTFGIEGISRACSHQLVRHRIASYSQQSQRYVDGESFEFVTPPEIESNERAMNAYKRVIDMQSSAYAEIRNALVAEKIKTLYKDDYTGETDLEIMDSFKEKNKKEYSKLLKKANEDARFVLPNACTTKIVCTFNARSLENFFAHRCCNRAQWEIREVAEQMLKLCLQAAPNIFKNCGPSCLFGPCPEGKMSCGRAAEVRKNYGR